MTTPRAAATISDVMRATTRRAFWAAGLAASAAAAQAPEKPLAEKLPDGRSRDLQLAKRDHEKALEDVGRIRTLAEETEEALKADTEHVVNLDTLEKLERIEELCRDVRKRLQRRY